MAHSQVVEDRQRMSAQEGNIAARCTAAARDVGWVAYRWLSPARAPQEFTFAQLEADSSRFANVLQTLGFTAGDVFFTFLPKLPEQFTAFLGALKQGLVPGPAHQILRQFYFRNKAGTWRRPHCFDWRNGLHHGRIPGVETERRQYLED